MYKVLSAIFFFFQSFKKICWVAIASKELWRYPSFCWHLHHHLRMSPPEELSMGKPSPFTELGTRTSKWHIKKQNMC